MENAYNNDIFNKIIQNQEEEKIKEEEYETNEDIKERSNNYDGY